MDPSVKVGNVRLKNPIILASAGYTATRNGLERCVRKGFGAIVTKTTTNKPLEGSPPPRMFWYDPDRKSMLAGAEALRNPGIEKMGRAVSAVKKLAEAEKCLIVGSLAGNTAAEMVEVASRFVDAGADLLELNLACPVTGPYLGPDYEKLGKYWCQTRERAVEAIQAVKGAVKVPVWAKCVLNTIVQEGFLKKVDEEAKPDGYSFVGGRLPCLVIDVETGKPRFPGSILLQIKKGIPISPMVTGPVKSSTILHTAYLARITSTPLIPSGGLYRGEDVIEAMMAGGSSIQICTEVYRNPNASIVFLKEIEAFMKRKKIDSLAEIFGAALQYVPAPPLLKVPILS